MKKDISVESSASLLAVLDGAKVAPPPIWFMRQAGRYLPEYRDVRARAGGFLKLCLNPEMAAEVTLQPVRRFGLDAAILFSDILIVPHALGVKLWFEDGEGPRLEPVVDEGSFGGMRTALDGGITTPVYETLAKVRATLPQEVALIGFCGAPWTVSTYLVAGRGTEDQAPAKDLARRNEQLFGRIIDRLVEATAEHLVGQLKAGAEIVQLFDTWAGSLDAAGFERWCVTPTAAIVAKVREQVPGARVILFPKGVGLDGLERLWQACKADGVSLDASVDVGEARKRLGTYCALQGNLDPVTLLAGGVELDREVDEIVEGFRGARHIFNLGHGILKETPIEHVERMVARVRQGSA